MIKDKKINDAMWAKLDTAEDLIQEVWQHLADNGNEIYISANLDFYL